MKSGIAIMTDTNSGITHAQAAQCGITLVHMPVIIDGRTYYEDVSIGPAEFYDRLRSGADVKTSQPSPGDLIGIWESLLQRYEEVIYIPMSGGLSGSCATATMLASEFDGRVLVADNRRISVTLRQSVLEAKYLADEGKSAGEIVRYLEQDGMEADIFVAVNTLEYLKRSGRVTAAGAAIGTVLQIKPVLQIRGGKLDAYRKVRGMKAAMTAMIGGLRHDMDHRFGGQPVTIRAAYTGDIRTGEQWRLTLQEAFPDLVIDLDPLPLSIACHTGEGALGVGIMRDLWRAG